MSQIHELVKNLDEVIDDSRGSADNSINLGQTILNAVSTIQRGRVPLPVGDYSDYCRRVLFRSSLQESLSWAGLAATAVQIIPEYGTWQSALVAGLTSLWFHFAADRNRRYAQIGQHLSIILDSSTNQVQRP